MSLITRIYRVKTQKVDDKNNELKGTGYRTYTAFWNYRPKTFFFFSVVYFRPIFPVTRVW
jgi:hypothetical protein